MALNSPQRLIYNKTQPNNQRMHFQKMIKTKKMIWGQIIPWMDILDLKQTSVFKSGFYILKRISTDKDFIWIFFNPHTHTHIYEFIFWFGLVWFYGIPTIVGYLMLNPLSATNPPSEIVITIYCCDIYIYLHQIYDL